MMTLYRQTAPKSMRTERGLGHEFLGWHDIFSPHFGVPRDGGAKDVGGSLGYRRVVKGEGGYDVWIDIPGVLESDVEVQVTGEGNLEVKARRYWDSEKEKSGDEKEDSRVHELYHRVFSLSEGIDKDSVSAEVESGVLRVSLSFVEKEGSRRIDVKGKG